MYIHSCQGLLNIVQSVIKVLEHSNQEELY